MSRLAIIPARGGSKRIIDKNIKLFLGKPIIAYAIENAINSKLFDEVMVSTNDKKISQIASVYGAKVPFMRTDKNSGDHSTTFEMIEEVIDSYSKLGKKFELACCIYPCTPLLSIKKINEGLKVLLKNNLDCVFPIVRFGFPIQRAVKINNNMLVEMIYPEHLVSRSQDLEAYFHDAGQFYFFKISNLLLNKKLLTSNTGHIELSEIETQDIDNLVDWKMAELKYKMINNI
tara:strand:+ start:11978 stop:12670 length:693 start_codon:yes stop_codon:yes gene_type:complete